jgi:hypothetical protein
MDLPRVKYSRGKIIPHLDLHVGTTLGRPGQRDNQLKILHRILEDKETDTFFTLEAKVMEETIKYLHFKNCHLNFLPKL